MKLRLSLSLIVALTSASAAQTLNTAASARVGISAPAASAAAAAAVKMETPIAAPAPVVLATPAVFPAPLPPTGRSGVVVEAIPVDPSVREMRGHSAGESIQPEVTLVPGGAHDSERGADRSVHPRAADEMRPPMSSSLYMDRIIENMFDGRGAYADKTLTPASSVSGNLGASKSKTRRTFALGTLLMLTPAIAHAAAVAPGVPEAASASISYLASIKPAAAVAGGGLGVIYGMLASYAGSKDGEGSSNGDFVSSILRYGALGYAGVYALFSMIPTTFAGPTAIGLTSLSGAAAIAAFGRTAFQGKFSDPATTGADRLLGAFPAIAAAVGLGVAAATGLMTLVAPSLAPTLAAGAMAATGVATAFYVTGYQPGRSPDSPAVMAKGFVLQALMTGLALAVSAPALFWPFTALAATGFGLVLWATAREIITWVTPGFLPPAPLPPTTTSTPAPTTPAPSPAPNAPAPSPAPGSSGPSIPEFPKS